MGSGKTTIGKLLSHKLDLEYFDTDEVIQQKSGLTIAEIFVNQGEKLFRNWEQIVLQESLLKYKCIISTGGGLPCYADNMKWINKYGKSVYLKTSNNVLTDRLKNKTYFRPLIADKNDMELIEYIDYHIKQREPFYNKANYIIDTDSLTPEQVAKEIMLELGIWR